MNSESEELLRLEKMLLHCPNLQDLAIWTNSSKFLLPSLEKLSLKRLLANFRDLTHDDYLRSTFSNITHLEVIAFHGRTWKDWEVLSKLPHLSHLIIGCCVDVDVFPKLLLYAPRLRILIFTPGRPSSGDRRIHQHPFTINEDRLVLLIRVPDYDLIRDWSKDGESGLDYWMFCELVSVARKRRFNFTRFHCLVFISVTYKYFFITVGKFFLDNSQQWFERNFEWDKNLTDEGKKWYSELNWPNRRSKNLLK